MAGPKLAREQMLLDKVRGSSAKKAAPTPSEFSRRAPSPHIKEVPRNIPRMRELIATEAEIRTADRGDIYSLVAVMRACREWSAFHKASTMEEDDLALPYFRRFVRAMKSYISDSPQERAIPAIRELAELIQIDVPSVSFVFTELCADPRQDVGEVAFRALEKNAYLLLNSMDLYSKRAHSLVEQIGTILETYAQNLLISPETINIDEANGDSIHPHPPNEEIAASIATYLFFQKEGLLRNQEALDLLPYTLSWSSDHYDADKIDFMIDTLSELPHGFQKEIFLKVAILANSEAIRHCALDLLIDMGVYSVSSEVDVEGMDGSGYINSMLKQKFTETYGNFANNIVMPPTSLIQ